MVEKDFFHYITNSLNFREMKTRKLVKKCNLELQYE